MEPKSERSMVKSREIVRQQDRTMGFAAGVVITGILAAIYVSVRDWWRSPAKKPTEQGADVGAAKIGQKPKTNGARRT